MHYRQAIKRLCSIFVWEALLLLQIQMHSPIKLVVNAFISSKATTMTSRCSLSCNSIVWLVVRVVQFRTSWLDRCSHTFQIYRRWRFSQSRMIGVVGYKAQIRSVCRLGMDVGQVCQLSENDLLHRRAPKRFTHEIYIGLHGNLHK